MITIETWGKLQTILAPKLEVEASGTVQDILIHLTDAYPAFSAQAERTACAVGDELVPRSYALATGDTLVLIPPVAGG